MRKLKVGVIGCGNISDIYLKNTKEMFDILEPVAVADLDMKKARNQAEKYELKAVTVEEILSDKEIEIILNLTNPQAHKIVCEKALNAGKHVYVEKPLALTREDGKFLLELAKDKGLKIGCAPDTFLGGGIQTCKKLIDDGWIGTPIAASAFMTCHGHESWHPAPEFYYKIGGGPMFDMGPYYLAALISLMGPVEKVTGGTNITFPQRTITSEPLFGKVIDVEVPTHIAGIMNFKNGAIGTITMSFDVWAANLPRIEIYGTEGTLSVPDPNTFDGPVLIRKSNDMEFKEIPLTHGFSENSRGLGLAEMAYSIINETHHRANSDLGYHVLDIMHGFHDSANEEKHISIQSSCEMPKAMPFAINKNNISKKFL